MLFPPEQLQLILQLTNNKLAMARKTTQRLEKLLSSLV